MLLQVVFDLFAITQQCSLHHLCKQSHCADLLTFHANFAPEPEAANSQIRNISESMSLTKTQRERAARHARHRQWKVK